MVSALSGMNLQGAPDQTLNSVLAGRQSYENSQLNKQALKQGEQQIARADYDQGIQRLGVINRLAVKAKSLNPQERYSFVQSINPEMLKSVGIDPAQISSVQLDDNSLDALIAQTSAALPKATGEAASFNEMTSGLSADEREKARRVALGLDPRAQGSAAMTIADRGLTGTVGASQAEIERQKALATGGVELALSPEQKRREAQAEADVKLATQPGIDAATTTAEKDAEAAAAVRSSAGKAVKVSENLLSNIDEAKKLLPKATGSGLGAARDVAGNIIGVSSEASRAADQLDTLAGWMVANVPRMEGPQSNIDVENYRIMAGRVGNRSLPVESRMAALDTLERLQKRYSESNKASQGGGKNTATPGINPEAKTVNWNDL